MKIGYARTSTLEQVAGFEAQVRELVEAGAERTYKEQVSSVGPRPEFDRLMDALRADDVLMVTKLDRLARSVHHLGEILQRLESIGAKLHILNLGLDTSTPTGKMMLNVLGSVAQFEREMMLERQREGIAKAKADGKYKGRKPKLDANQVEAMKKRIADGESKASVAKSLGITRTTLYEYLK